MNDLDVRASGVFKTFARAIYIYFIFTHALLDIVMFLRDPLIVQEVRPQIPPVCGEKQKKKKRVNKKNKEENRSSKKNSEIRAKGRGRVRTRKAKKNKQKKNNKTHTHTHTHTHTKTFKHLNFFLCRRPRSPRTKRLKRRVSSLA